jgi:hypothetical protein
LSVPLAAWAGFTDIASHLPGEAGDKMLQMNREARQLQDTFTQMGEQMLGLDCEQPARQAELENDASRLDATGEQAKTSAQDVRIANAGARALRNANEAALGEANRMRNAATSREQQLADAVAKREARADSLAQQLNAWAAAHKAARDQAVQTTVARLQREGKTIVRSEQP